MNFASTVPQLQADFFNEKGVLKEYRPSVHFNETVQYQQQQQQTGGMFALRKIPIASLTPSSVSESASDPDPVPDPIPTPDFPFQEFPLTEVENQSQIDSSSISDTRECSSSLRKATKSTDLPLKSGFNNRSHEENRDLTVSDKHAQSSRDSSTISISDNSTTRESIPGIIPGITPGIMTDTPSTPNTPSTPTTFPVETDVTEIPEEIQAQSNRSVMPTDIQALTALQS